MPTRPALAAATVLLYPNPAPGTFTVLVPTGDGVAIVQAELLNALNQPVHRQAAAIGTPFMVETAGLAPDTYTLRLETCAAILARRVVIQ